MMVEQGSEFGWVVEEPGSIGKKQLSVYTESGVRTRRFHHKSRKGCIGCKQRRVKCDEAKPSCGQCQDKQFDCDYGQLRHDPSESPSPPLKPTKVSNKSPCSRYADQILATLASANAPCGEFEKTAVYRREHAIGIIDHFFGFKDPWLGSPQCQRILQEHGLHWALKTPFLLHTIIAISAAHLAYLYPNEKRYWIASTLHYQLSLSLYSAVIDCTIEQVDPEALLAANLLHAMLAFVKTPQASEHLPLKDDVGPTWVTSMQGVRVVLNCPGLGPLLRGSVWQPLIDELNRWRDRPTATDPPSQEPPILHPLDALNELCKSSADGLQIDSEKTRREILHALSEYQPCHQDIDGFIAIVADKLPTFLGRPDVDDERTLSILSYWCAAFGRIDQWWIGPSATIEYKRICAHFGADQDAMDPMLSIPVGCPTPA